MGCIEVHRGKIIKSINFSFFIAWDPMVINIKC